MEPVQRYVTTPLLTLGSRFLTASVMPMMLLAVISGLAMLFLQRRAGLSAQLVDEGSAIILKLFIGFEKALPVFVFVSMLSTALGADAEYLDGGLLAAHRHGLMTGGRTKVEVKR